MTTDKTEKEIIHIKVNNTLELVFDGKNFNLTLGNLSTAGWYWTGNTDDLFGFMKRGLNGYSNSEEFIKELEQNLPFSVIKPYLVISVKTGDGLYELSGDNPMWKFEGVYDLVEDNLQSDLVAKLTLNYEKFERYYKKEIYIKEAIKLINSSTTYLEFQKKLLNFEIDIRTEVVEYVENEIAKETGKTFNKHNVL